MANKIQFKRGLKGNLTTLDLGEPALCTDTEEVYIGGSTSNIPLVTGAQLSEKASILDLAATNAIVTTNTNDILLKADKTYVDAQLYEKANITDVNTQIAAVASGSPKGIYTTLSALQSAYPTGNSNIYLVTANGSWYFWNGSAWTSGGTYQSTGIANDSITIQHLKSDVAEQLGNYLYKPYWTKFITSLSANFSENGNGDLEATAATTSIKSTNTNFTLDFTKNIKYEFEINVDTSKTFGAMVGFSDDASVQRFLVGYEPAHLAIEIYNEGLFYKLIDNPSNGQYKFVIERDKDNNIYIYVNDVLYRASDYVTVSGTFTRFRLQLKTTDLGLILQDLSLSYEDKVIIASDDRYYKQYGQYGKTKGKGIYVYQFGGKGNDWCFVRTPDSYDPQGNPSPFVICNHGNGWVMDGTLAKANWTKRTMYVTASDTDYIANPTQYNVVPDGDPLLYSNPTIEALLAAGYIVCGAQNYDDNLYGNDDCRQACVDFYHHMMKNYNVEEQCFMIGASNGAMTSLNAVYLLGVSRIKAMILQYPLTCLWRHYTNYSAHQSAIHTAYGISAGLTEAQFEKATRTHDPEKVCTITNVNGVNRFKTMPMPPIKFWYSNGDTTTAPTNNSLALIQVLEDSNCVYESVEASGNHGDYTHFDPAAYAAWFEKWR